MLYSKFVLFVLVDVYTIRNYKVSTISQWRSTPHSRFNYYMCYQRSSSHVRASAYAVYSLPLSIISARRYIRESRGPKSVSNLSRLCLDSVSTMIYMFQTASHVIIPQICKRLFCELKYVQPYVFLYKLHYTQLDICLCFYVQRNMYKYDEMLYIRSCVFSILHFILNRVLFIDIIVIE